MTRKVTYLIIALLSTSFYGCNNEQAQVIPNVFVDIQINLNDNDFIPLNQDGGFVYIQGGVRGILVYHESGNNYRAFERNCTFQPEDDCAQVEVDNSLLFIHDECCGSQYGFDGQVMSGPTVLPLKEYSTSISGNYLYINN